jgi:hypothetical protein
MPPVLMLRDMPRTILIPFKIVDYIIDIKRGKSNHCIKITLKKQGKEFKDSKIPNQS